MTPDTDVLQTPLENLFFYIRDLFDTSQDCPDFRAEPGNSKMPGVNYWEVGQLLPLARTCAQKHLSEFRLNLSEPSGESQDKSGDSGGPILTIRRIPLPPAPTWTEPEADPPTDPAKVAAEGQELARRRKAFDVGLRAYRQQYAAQLQINALYDALHSLYYELRGREAKRLYLSFGLISGAIGGTGYCNFLFHVPLKLRLKNHEITIDKDTFASKIHAEQSFAELLGAHFPKESPSVAEERKTEVLLAVDRFNAHVAECIFHPAFIRSEYFEPGWEILGVFPQKEAAFFKADELDYTFQPEPIHQQITFSFSPVLQTKLVASQVAVSRDAAHIIRKLHELEAENRLQDVPDFFKKLFAINHETEEPIGHRAFLETEAPAPRYLFPLPYNQEQFEIAKRLREQDAVTVKGPPGTGKSHTIANLISHFVADGQSILVVSHNAKALDVLKGKLPGGIQDLAVSLVGEGKGNEGLKASVGAIIRNISRHYEPSVIESLEGQLGALEHKYAHLLSEIYKAIEANTERFRIYLNGKPEERSAYEWARFLFEQPAYEPVYLKDSIHHTLDTEGLGAQLADMAEIALGFEPGDYDLIHYHFLQDHAFMDLQDLRRAEVRLEEIVARIQLDDYANVDPSVADEDFQKGFARFKEDRETFASMPIAEAIFRHQDFDGHKLDQLLQANQALRDQVESADQQLLPFELDLSPLRGTDPDVLYRQINQLLVRCPDHGTVGKLNRTLMDKSLRRFFACRVNWNPVTDAGHLRLIEMELNRERCLKQLSITFQNYLRKFGVLAPVNMSEALKELDFLNAFSRRLAVFNTVLRLRGLPRLDPGRPGFEEACQYLDGLSDYVDYKAIRTQLETASGRMSEHDSPHPLVFNMARAVLYVDRAGYELYLSQYRRKRGLQAQSIRFDQLYKAVSRVLPLTVLDLKEQPRPLDETLFEEDVFHASLDSFLSQVMSRTRGTEDLLRDLQAVKRGIERQTAELISYKAWYNKSRKVGDLQKAALNAWLNDLINIGKGYGKNTARNMASAIRNMQIAKEAVPIWIMPQENAVTFFPDASPGQFDVLIIDEASQCDISSLNLVFRCRKCLIVGDENQTSVVSDRSFFSIDRTNELLNKYLITHRFKTQFDVNNKNNSIYTISGVIYPNIVTLTEHFRCLPEIIGYSNEYIYNQDIVPLKTATERPFGEPLGLYYVEDIPDLEEKPLVVRKVIEIIEAYIMQFRDRQINRLPTVGIITLDGSHQRHQQALIKAVAASDLIKQHEDALQLLIGTSREFQGDERDVMVLTITAGHSIWKEGEEYRIRPPRAVSTEEHMRIFNVAASRARERSILIHSIHPDAVALMNPECYRKKLIDYYGHHQLRQEPETSRTLAGLLDQVDAYAGDFEKSVCRYLFEHGWGDFLFPQLQVGKYRIDFGLIHRNRKLAIECDGFTHYGGKEKVREDIQRQLILERANWQFFRIQSTDWFRRQEAVGASLLRWIGEVAHPGPR